MTLRSTALALAAAVLSASAQAAPADPGRMSETVKVLASDAFEGRAPGTAGEARTVEYLIQRFQALGLKPGGENGGWTQAVPLLHTRVLDGAQAAVTIGAARTPLVQKQDIYLGTVSDRDRVTLSGAPLVFVGYGVSAPERGWDDFKGVDLRGKIAVFLINDPDFEAQPGEPVAGKFGGKAMTYYGRWTYKYEEAARRGAAGALIVHETAGAAYPWTTVIAPNGETYDAVRAAGDGAPVPVQGWIQRDAAVEMFRKIGLDFEALKRLARTSDFRPIDLTGAKMDIDLPIAREVVNSRNILARIDGAQAADETVMIAAHWDAYGIGAPDAQGRTIRPGANDDGLGVAGVLELARTLSAGKPPRRSLVFALWTAEERGLLGSEYYARHPLYRPQTMAANLTIDILQTAGPARDVVLVGAGQDSLERDLAIQAAKQGRVVTPDAHPERGLFYRADHFSVAKRGVPTLLLMAAGGGPDLVQGGRAAGEAWVDAYTANCYHKTCDAWSADWNLSGAAQDVDLFHAIARDLADGKAWPTWNPGSEFRDVRERSAADRKS